MRFDESPATIYDAVEVELIDFVRPCFNEKINSDHSGDFLDLEEKQTIWSR